MNRTEAGLVADTLGLSDLELSIYVELLRSGSSTGYGLAKSLGRAGANVYQALGSLRQKGAVIASDSGGKTLRALPPEDLIAMIERSTSARLAETGGLLAKVERAAVENEVYRLSNVAQALERITLMIDRAEEILLFDFYPEPFRVLLPSLEAARARRVLVFGVIYEEVDAAQQEWTCRADLLSNITTEWPGQGMIAAADAREHAVCLLDKGGERLLHGIWSDSRYLSCIQHSNIGCEIRFHLLSARYGDLMPEVGLAGARPPGLRDLARAAS